MSISDQLRAAIRESGKSANVIAKESGVPQSTVSRFLSGADMKASTIDRLANHFGLSLQPGNPTAAAKSKVKAPAVPAVDWATAQPETKRKGLPTGKPSQPNKPAKGKR